MLKPLRRKLAFAYTLMAGVVLALVSLICLHTAEVQLQVAAKATFDSGVNAVIYKLQSESMLSQAWLSQSEAGARQIIHIEENGAPLSFQGAWTPLTDRQTLIKRAHEQADSLGLALPLGSLEPSGIAFEIRGEKAERYHASVTLIPSITKPLQCVTVIKDMRLEDARIERQRRTTLALVASGLILLMVSGWFYSGRAIKPAEESHRQQVEFVALASHELKSPLAVISSSAEALIGSDQEPLLHNIKTEAVRMARLVDDLLLLSRADAKTWNFHKKSIETDTLLIECYELFYPIAQAKQVSLTIDLPNEPLPALYGDAERLKQTLSVLLDNAITYTQPRGSVKLCADISGHCLRVVVSDDGPGILAEEKPHVFDRFFRSQMSHTDKEHAGLGLSIARELVQLHGGRIWVEDELPHGTRFILELPFHRMSKILPT